MNISNAALLGGKNIKELIKKAGAEANRIKQDTSKPGHIHSSEKEKPVYDKPPEVGGVSSDPAPSFMGKNQVDDFKILTDPLSVDRGGRTVAQPDGLDKVGILPAMNPPMAVPTSPNIDEQGVNSLYSDKM